MISVDSQVFEVFGHKYEFYLHPSKIYSYACPHKGCKDHFICASHTTYEAHVKSHVFCQTQQVCLFCILQKKSQESIPGSIPFQVKDKSLREFFFTSMSMIEKENLQLVPLFQQLVKPVELNPESNIETPKKTNKFLPGENNIETPKKTNKFLPGNTHWEKRRRLNKSDDITLSVEVPLTVIKENKSDVNATKPNVPSNWDNSKSNTNPSGFVPQYSGIWDYVRQIEQLSIQQEILKNVIGVRLEKRHRAFDDVKALNEIITTALQQRTNDIIGYIVEYAQTNSKTV
jgi:hypothetical protein